MIYHYLMMTLKLWTSGMTAVISIGLVLIPFTLISGEAAVLYVIALANRIPTESPYWLAYVIVVPYLVGAVQYWFWRDAAKGENWIGQSRRRI